MSLVKARDEGCQEERLGDVADIVDAFGGVGDFTGASAWLKDRPFSAENA
jgi:hypothetical protein